MPFIWAWLVKLLSGFAIWKGQQLGKIIWVSAIVIVILFASWKLFIQKAISNSQRIVVQSGGTSYSTTIPQPKVGFGCMRIDTVKSAVK